jgi:DNA-binding CsgD family transcriptional regulator
MEFGHEAMSLLALSHTPAEHRLYRALLGANSGATGCVGAISLRGLLQLTGLPSYSTLRRARAGLVAKCSIDCKRKTAANGSDEKSGSLYFIYGPGEIFDRRRDAGLAPYPAEYSRHAGAVGFSAALERVVEGNNLSRREAQVALCCAEGLTNAEIGEKLFIAEQTVKYHLRQIFTKFGVRRRGELISRLLRQDDSAAKAAVADFRR